MHLHGFKGLEVVVKEGGEGEKKQSKKKENLRWLAIHVFGKWVGTYLKRMSTAPVPIKPAYRRTRQLSRTMNHDHEP